MALELGSRRRPQPAPPGVVFEALTEPRREGGRPWLDLADGELEPTILVAEEPHRVVWSSLWPDRPHDRIEFELAPAGTGTDLRWTLLTPDEEAPSDAVLGRLRYRLNHLINADLRYSFGQ
ncbi:SRPBCC family protein [Tenggerimyces flavus]|uniref:SRPBCC domain-containing protein n=1 Tax=Tenggerimyces flavus TaxID=1708749 RepID=A0ABV7YHL3_9ACTN|nr:hypothetical protein [Tenggerimyces flavus]MBM7789316.1 uncharacterized protein YndB with AHSA1/START domain [Tenggerimyces flavus]